MHTVAEPECRKKLERTKGGREFEGKERTRTKYSSIMYVYVYVYVYYMYMYMSVCLQVNSVDRQVGQS